MDVPDTRRARWFLTPRFLVVAGLGLVVGTVVVLVWFQPQKLFINQRVDEAAPDAIQKDNDAMEKDDSMNQEGAMLSLAGSFSGIGHDTSGSAILAKAPDGHYYVRLEDFETENGPDLYVYLSAAPASAEEGEFTDDFLDLGRLKGNIGNQNYLVPDEVDLEKYRSVVIWCSRFSTAFGAAPLDAQ